MTLLPPPNLALVLSPRGEMWLSTDPHSACNEGICRSQPGTRADLCGARQARLPEPLLARTVLVSESVNSPHPLSP